MWLVSSRQGRFNCFKKKQRGLFFGHGLGWRVDWHRWAVRVGQVDAPGSAASNDRGLWWQRGNRRRRRLAHIPHAASVGHHRGPAGKTGISFEVFGACRVARGPLGFGSTSRVSPTCFPAHQLARLRPRCSSPTPLRSILTQWVGTRRRSWRRPCARPTSLNLCSASVVLKPVSGVVVVFVARLICYFRGCPLKMKTFALFWECHLRTHTHIREKKKKNTHRALIHLCLCVLRVV